MIVFHGFNVTLDQFNNFVCCLHASQSLLTFLIKFRMGLCKASFKITKASQGFKLTKFVKVLYGTVRKRKKSSGNATLFTWLNGLDPSTSTTASDSLSS